MSDETTLEEATRCYKCQQVGEVQVKARNRDGSKSLLVKCRNSRCVLNGEVVRLIDTHPDGSIPTPKMHRDKMYPARPDRTEDVRAMIDRQLLTETQKGDRR